MSLQFPNVPLLAGVPQVARSILFPPTGVPVLNDQQSQVLWESANAAPIWGIVDSNHNFVVTPDSVLDFDFRKEFRVANFQIQSGGFASYNKVNLPFEIVVRMSKGGDQQSRTDFLAQIQAIADTTDLYSILTPEKTYQNCNITRSELSRRGEEGAFFIEVDVFFIEIRQVSAQYSATAANTQNAQQPSDQPPINTGTVQPQPITPGIANGITGGTAGTGAGGVAGNMVGTPSQVSVQLGANAVQNALAAAQSTGQSFVTYLPSP